MQIEVFEGKEEKEVLNQALEKLGVSESEVLYYTTKNKVGILKKEVVSIHITTYASILNYLKDYLATLTKHMGLLVTFESKIRENQIMIKMYSDNNKILIGKNGQTLEALTMVAKQLVYNNIKHYPYLLLDVENYKEKREKSLCILAKKFAKEVAATKNSIELENMNSYERRIIHNALADSKKVYTESIGEEPERHIVIKPKEE